jgi:hypothetical protein
MQYVKLTLIAILVILSVMLSMIHEADSDDFHILELKEVYVDYLSFFKGGRDPLITQNGLRDKHLDKELNLNLNMNLFKYGYFNSMIHSMTDKDSADHGQFRLVGLKFETGIRLTNWIEVGYHHFSQHLLDYNSPNAFPVQDAVQIRLFLLRTDKINSIF